MKKLIGCINNLTYNKIKTRFFYLDTNTHEVRDITIELCDAIDEFNREAEEIRANGDYSMIIPYKYKEGTAEYSFGCGLSHYLQESEFGKITHIAKEILTFPLYECDLQMLVPSDIKHILECKNAFDLNIYDALVDYYS